MVHDSEHPILETVLAAIHYPAVPPYAAVSDRGGFTNPTIAP